MENSQVEMRINRAKQVREKAEALKNKAKELLDEGNKPSEVAKKLNVSLGTVVNWLHKQ